MTQTEKDLKSIDSAVSRIRFLREFLDLKPGEVHDCLVDICGSRMVLEFHQLEDLQTLIAQLENERCPECGDRIRHHGPDGCEVELGDNANGVAAGPCSCMAVSQ